MDVTRDQIRSLVPANFGHVVSGVVTELLLEYGYDRFYVSPGYRNAPFVEALRLLAPDQMVSCFDERAAAFEALGYAKSGRGKAVMLCTSGTAGANYLPAMIEASHENLPLLAIICDRPFELLGTASNQVTQQSEFFLPFVKRRLLLPTAGVDLKIRDLVPQLRDMLEELLKFPTGVGHINLPFREPLEPVESVEPSAKAYLDEYQEIMPQLLQHTATDCRWESQTLPDRLVDALQRSERPLLLVGRLDTMQDRGWAEALLRKWNFPVFLDICSGLKYQFSSLPDPKHPKVRDFLDSYRPDLILHVGRRLVTRSFEKYFSGNFSGRSLILGSETASFRGIYGHQTFQYSLPLGQLVPGVLHPEPWKQWQHARDIWQSYLESDRWSIEPSVSYSIDSYLKCLYSYCGQRQLPILVGNSSLIRSLDGLQGLFVDQAPRIYANRGVSGIEGLLATAKGLYQVLSKPVYLLLGDVSLLHDLNSLVSLAQPDYRVCVIVLNNFGGGIFRQMPIGSFSKLADPWVTTPHQLQFRAVCEFANVTYRAFDLTRPSMAEFENSLADLEHSKLIEIIDDSNHKGMNHD